MYNIDMLIKDLIKSKNFGIKAWLLLLYRLNKGIIIKPLRALYRLEN